MTQQPEARLRNEYLFKAYPNNLQWKNVKLGQLPTVEDAKFYKVALRRADAIVYDGHVLTIIEMKIDGDVGAIAQLELYRDLLRVTPEFSQLWDKEIKLEFVTAVLDENVRQYVESRGIKYIHFEPEWASRYIMTLRRVVLPK